MNNKDFEEWRNLVLEEVREFCNQKWRRMTEAANISKENSKPDKKYVFTGATRMYDGRVLRGIMLTEDDTFGGWIESEDNLSQEGKCFVYMDAMVYGDARVSEDAEVSGSAIVKGHAVVKGMADVTGNSIISGNAVIKEFCTIKGQSVVTDWCMVSGYTLVDNSKLSGNLKISGDFLVNELHFYSKEYIVIEENTHHEEGSLIKYRRSITKPPVNINLGDHKLIFIDDVLCIDGKWEDYNHWLYLIDEGYNDFRSFNSTIKTIIKLFINQK